MVLKGLLLHDFRQDWRSFWLDQAEIDQGPLLPLIRVADQQWARLEAVADHALAAIEFIETQPRQVCPGMDQVRTAVRAPQVAGKVPVVGFAPLWRGPGHERDGIHRRRRLALVAPEGAMARGVEHVF